MTKGQIMTSDFMLSVVIFLAVIGIVLPLYMTLSENSTSAQFSEDTQTRLFFASDVLLKTAGIPADWNATTARSIGVANSDGLVNKTKIRHLTQLSINGIKTLLGLQGLQFNISFYSGEFPLMTGEAYSPAAYFYAENNTLFAAINGSGLVWDLYYGGTGTPETGDARNAYTGSKAALFDEMTANGSAYRTIVVEDSGLGQGEINIDSLKNFVSTGGILIVEGRADIVASGFGMSSGSGGVVNGIVRDTRLIDAPEGSSVTFYDGTWYFYNTTGDSPLHIAVENSVSGGASIGKWSYGIGRIIYITDIHGFAGGVSLIDSVLVVGKKAEVYSSIINTAFVNSRAVVYDTDLNALGRAVVVAGE